MRAFHCAAPAEKPQAMERLTDKRFRSFAKRIIFDNFPELITDADKAAYDRAIAERLNREDDVPWVTVAKALEDGAKLLASNPDRRDEIDQITAFYPHHGELSTKLTRRSTGRPIGQLLPL